MKPTNVKRHILDLVMNCQAVDGRLTRAEICRHLSGLSDNVDLHVEQLVHEGLLSHVADEDSITLTPLSLAATQIKLSHGHGCGDQIPAINELVLDLRAVGISMDENPFAQVVSDDSMADAGIRKGDIAVFRAAEELEGGEIVAVEVDGQLFPRRYLVLNKIPHVLTENQRCSELLPAFEKPIYGVLCCVISPRQKATRPAAATQKCKANYMVDGPLDYKPTWWDVLGYELPAEPPTASLTVAAQRPQEARPSTRDAWPQPLSGNMLNERPDHSFGHIPTDPAEGSVAAQRKRKSNQAKAVPGDGSNRKESAQEPVSPRPGATSKTIRHRSERAFLRA